MICHKFYDTTIPRAMIRRKWLPKINLLHHLTNYLPNCIPHNQDSIFLKEFEHEAPFKVHEWPGKPDYGDVEEKEMIEEGFE